MIVYYKHILYIYMSCDFNKLYEGDFSQIKLCYTDLKLPVKQVTNPLNRTGIEDEELCFLLSDKKIAYYNIIYDPLQILEQIIEYNTDEKNKQEYLDKLKQIMVTEQKLNCCNCVSFIYYAMDLNIDEGQEAYIEFDYIDVLTKIYGYISSLKLSTINMKNKLSKFVARIYLDISLFKTIANAQKNNTSGKLTDIIEKLKNTITFLFEAINVEIYTYLCKSYSSRNLIQLRCQRFLIMIDPEVACSIIREADGYVTYLDCFNIQNFVDSKKIMLMYNFLDQPNVLDIQTFNRILNQKEILSDVLNVDIIKSPSYYKPYSMWLLNYQKIDDYYKTHYTLFDIFAGTLGINIQIKSDKFYEIFNLLSKQISYFDPTEQNGILNSGFDEIFLMNLFRDLYTIKKININELDKIKNIQFYMSNIFTVKKIYEIYYNDGIQSIDPFDFLKDEIKIKLNDMIRMFRNIFSIGDRDTTIFGAYHKIKQDLELKIRTMNISEPMQREMVKLILPNKPTIDTYSRLLLTTFDLCIDTENFKKVDYAINFKLFGLGADYNLLSNINYMFTKYFVNNIYFDIYENKYGNFYNQEKLSEIYNQKYLKYKQKYLKYKKSVKYY